MDIVAIAVILFFFFQAEDGIRDAQESRGLGDVYKRQVFMISTGDDPEHEPSAGKAASGEPTRRAPGPPSTCLLYTSDAADDLLCVDLGGRRILKKKQ